MSFRLEFPSDPGHPWDLPRRKILELEAVSVLEGPLEQGLGDFKADEVMIGIRGVQLAGYLHHVERELNLYMARWSVLIGHYSVFFTKLGITDGRDLVDARLKSPFLTAFL
jgi:hypothetical protein